MIDFLNKVVTFFQGKKRLLLPLFPFFLLIGFILFVLIFSFAPSSPSQDDALNPTDAIQQFPTQAPQFSPIPSVAVDDNFGTDADADLRNLSIYEKSGNLQQKETLPNGAVKLTLSSSVVNRPEIVIIDPQTDIVLFQRVVSAQNNNTLISQYITLYGQPQQTIPGSKFYGQNAQTYIFADNGVAVIANQQTNTIFEVHYFLPSTATAYITTYGDDLIATPTP